MSTLVHMHFFLLLSSKIFLGARDQVQGLIIARDVCFH